jgi:hypothetical protein
VSSISLIIVALASPLAAQTSEPFGLKAFAEPANFSPFAPTTSPMFAEPIPEFVPQSNATPAAALISADPLAPGQGPSFDAIGPISPEVSGPPKNFPFWYSRRMSGTWLSKTGSDGFGITDIETSTSFAPIYFDDVPALLITPGFGVHLWNSPGALDLPAQVYDFYLDINWRSPITERFGLGFGVTPGIYGDFQQVNSDSFQVTGWCLGDFTLTPRLTLVGGVAVVRQLESRVLPVGGLIWTPNDATRFELVVPRMRVARRVSESMKGSLWTYVAGQFGGGSWAITFDDGSTTLLTYNDLRIMWGVEWLTASRLSGVAEIGYVFSRDITAFDASQFTPTNSLLLRLGCTF